MRMTIVSVYDVASQSFGRPVFAVSVGAAIRSFGDEVNRSVPDNTMYAHPEDFVLYELGVFDDSSGAFVLLEHPKQVASGKQFKSVN